MKKTILLVLALGACAISQGQNVSKTTTTVVETKEVGDSTITTKIITTNVDGKTTVEKEVNVSRYIYENATEVEPEKIVSDKKKAKLITGLSFTGSFLNDNKAINNKLGMTNINDFNYGLLFNLGGATPFGMEFVFDFGFEGSINKSNNKQLNVLSSFISFNLGYPVIKLKNEKFMIVPRVGIGVNATQYNYVRTSDNNLTMDSIAGNAWTINQNNNFYIPLGLEFRFGSPKEYFVLAGEYRHTFYYSNSYLSLSKQKVSDFPDFGLNNVVIKIGFVGML
ncbi:MAG TPA: hypothetical protein DD434_11530 [Bacteroidales bacterium]|nr:hypothetical protein [Bacteroidales bacterium]